MAVSSENGAKLLTVIFLSSLMISLGIAAATDALIDNDRTTLHEKDTVNDVILHVSQLNEPGFQEGSVFTDTTLSAGGRHTCVILDNGSVSCWGLGSNGQLGGATSDRTTPTLTSSLGPGRTAVALSSGTHHTAPSLTTVLCRAGETDITANWATVEHLTNTLPRSRAALVRVALPWRSLPEVTTPAPSSTTVMCRAGDGDCLLYTSPSPRDCQ